MKLRDRFGNWVAHLIWAGDKPEPCRCEICLDYPESPVQVYKVDLFSAVPVEYDQTPEEYRDQDYPK